MGLSEWFEHQLRSTLDGFIWAAQQVPPERIYFPPPPQLGEWSVVQHVVHMLEYEERYAIPAMSQWLGVPPAIPEELERTKEPNPPLMEEKLARFERVRRVEIDMLSKFDRNAWNRIQRTTFWGDVSLYWLVCKTYQHTLEHTNNLLCLTLFWDSTARHPAH